MFDVCCTAGRAKHVCAHDCKANVTLHMCARTHGVLCARKNMISTSLRVFQLRSNSIRPACESPHGAHKTRCHSWRHTGVGLSKRASCFRRDAKRWLFHSKPALLHSMVASCICLAKPAADGKGGAYGPRVNPATAPVEVVL
jgi:hypothetical protein